MIHLIFDIQFNICPFQFNGVWELQLPLSQLNTGLQQPLQGVTVTFTNQIDSLKMVLFDAYFVR